MLIYDICFHKKNHYFRKEFLYDPFFTLRTLARIRQHYFSKYWGDGCMGRPPPQMFFLGGVPPRSTPLMSRLLRRDRGLLLPSFPNVTIKGVGKGVWGLKPPIRS